MWGKETKLTVAARKKKHRHISLCSTRPKSYEFSVAVVVRSEIKLCFILQTKVRSQSLNATRSCFGPARRGPSTWSVGPGRKRSCDRWRRTGGKGVSIEHILNQGGGGRHSIVLPGERSRRHRSVSPQGIRSRLGGGDK